MANRLEHEIIGALTGGIITLFNKGEAHKGIINPFTGMLVGKYAALLPDVFEPAFHPNHRKFFHSWMFLSLVGLSLYNAWKTKPVTTAKQIGKWFLLIGGAAYASHLLRDSITPKGLPLT